MDGGDIKFDSIWISDYEFWFQVSDVSNTCLTI